MKPSMRRAALYTRASTNTQITENQERQLREVAVRSDWQIVEVYEDRGIDQQVIPLQSADQH